MNSNFLKLSTFFHASLFAIILSGCGGGEASKTSMENDLPSPVAGGIKGEVLEPGSTGASPIPTGNQLQLPEVSVGQRQFADPNVLLNLRGTVVAPTGSQIVKTLWTQVTGPEVVIPSPQALDNIVLMPDVNLATQLEFRLTAQDSEGRINSATVSILVKPVPTFVKVVGGVFNEADEKVVFKIRLNAPSTSPVTVSYITQDGTAYSGASESSEQLLDYVASSGEVVFAPGEVLKEIPITVINDVIEESDETFSLQVTAIDGTATHANTGVVIIRNGVEPSLTQEIQFGDAGPINLYVGEERNNSVRPEDFDVIYSSSDTSVAYVTSNGVVAGMSVGTATITATKPANDTYLSASNSYTVNVVSRGTPPVVSIVDSYEFNEVDGYSVLVGDSVKLTGKAADQEDGELPTEAQRNQSAVTGQSINTLSWHSDISGFLGNGEQLDINTLPQGTHHITYSVTDSHGNTGSATTRILVGNLSPFAYSVYASSTYCSDQTVELHCYYPYRVNDTVLSTELGGLYSWVNNNLTETKLPQSVTLNWYSLATINSVDIYTTE
ncbi:MAG: Calx-beta domain-containing protein, partial [Cellvibrio sp.]